MPLPKIKPALAKIDEDLATISNGVDKILANTSQTAAFTRVVKALSDGKIFRQRGSDVEDNSAQEKRQQRLLRQQRMQDESQKEALARSQARSNPLVPLTKNIAETLSSSHVILTNILDTLEKMSDKSSGGNGLFDSLYDGAFAGGGRGRGRAGARRGGRGRARPGPRPRTGGGLGRRLGGAARAVGRSAAAGATAVGSGIAAAGPILGRGARAIGQTAATAGRATGQAAARVVQSGALRGLSKALGPAAAVLEAGLVISDNFDELATEGKISVLPQVEKSFEGVKAVFAGSSSVMDRLGGALDTASGAVGTVAAAGTQVGKIVNDVIPNEFEEQVFLGFGLLGESAEETFDRQEREFQADMAKMRAANKAKKEKEAAEIKKQEAERKVAEAEKLETENKLKEAEKKKSTAQLKAVGAVAAVGAVTGKDLIQKSLEPSDAKKVTKVEISQPVKSPVPVNLTDKDGTPWEDKVQVEGDGQPSGGVVSAPTFQQPSPAQDATKMQTAQAEVQRLRGVVPPATTNTNQVAQAAQRTMQPQLRNAEKIAKQADADLRSVAPKTTPKVTPSPSERLDKEVDLSSGRASSGQTKAAITKAAETAGVPTAASPTGFKEGFDWVSFKETLAQYESGGKYDIKGGAGGKYSGKYQMGHYALIDAGLLKPGSKSGDVNNPDAWTIPGGREAFLKNPQLQEQGYSAYITKMRGYTAASLNRYGIDFEQLSVQDQAGVVAAAHLTGQGTAAKAFATGQGSKDQFGTSNLKYMKAAQKSQTAAGRVAQKPLTSAAPLQATQSSKQISDQIGTPPPSRVSTGGQPPANAFLEQLASDNADQGILATINEIGDKTAGFYENNFAALRGVEGADPVKRRQAEGQTTNYRQSGFGRGEQSNIPLDQQAIQRVADRYSSLDAQRAFAQEASVTGAIPSNSRRIDSAVESGKRQLQNLKSLTIPSTLNAQSIQGVGKSVLGSAQDLLSGELPKAIGPILESGTLSDIQSSVSSMKPPSAEEMANVTIAATGGKGGGTSVTGVPKQAGVETELDVRNPDSSIRRLTDSLLAYSFG